MGRLFGALVSKAGIPVPTEITQKVLTTARHLQSGSTSVPGFDLPQVQNLGWGQIIGGTVERQTAHFYRISISDSDLARGVIISCTSHGSDKFKLVFFDREGSVAMVEESQVFAHIIKIYLLIKKELTLMIKFNALRFHYYSLQKKKKQSEANLYIVPFAHYTLHESMPLSMMKRMDEDVPPGEK
jgi:hypothetical protein